MFRVPPREKTDARKLRRDCNTEQRRAAWHLSDVRARALEIYYGYNLINAKFKML